MIITFCGHDEVTDPEAVWAWLDRILEQLICEDDVTCYLGGYGGFDRLAASVVRKKKLHHPNVQAILIIPYLNRDYDKGDYDYVVFPPLESVPPRFAISKRNEWMIRQSDIVIAYVTHGWGGAAKSIEYAKRKKKRILFYCGSD